MMEDGGELLRPVDGLETIATGWIGGVGRREPLSTVPLGTMRSSRHSSNSRCLGRCIDSVNRHFHHDGTG
jgi:hypothetical protein